MKAWPFALALFISACSSHVDLLKAEYISMVSVKPPTSLAVGRKISAKWCLNEAPLAPGIGDGEVGLIDQVVLRANKKYKVAYILKPEIGFDRGGLFGSSCVKMAGYLPKGA